MIKINGEGGREGFKFYLDKHQKYVFVEILNKTSR
jgi:hypothetical protein